jgi:hypothetical protein
VAKRETLRAAYAVAKKNNGAPGRDGVTFEAIEVAGVEAFLGQLRDELVSRTYRPLRTSGATPRSFALSPRQSDRPTATSSQTPQRGTGGSLAEAEADVRPLLRLRNARVPARPARSDATWYVRSHFREVTTSRTCPVPPGPSSSLAGWSTGRRRPRPTGGAGRGQSRPRRVRRRAGRSKTRRSRWSRWTAQSSGRPPTTPGSSAPKSATKLKAGIKKIGILAPPVWNKRTGHIVSGHQRVSILDDIHGGKDYRLKVAVVNLDETKEKEANILLNNYEAQGSWDLDKLGQMFNETDLDIEATGFDVADIYQLFGDSPFANRKDSFIEALATRLREARDTFEKLDALIKTRVTSTEGYYIVVAFRDEPDRREFLERLHLEDNRFQDERCGNSSARRRTPSLRAPGTRSGDTTHSHRPRGSPARAQRPWDLVAEDMEGLNLGQQSHRNILMAVTAGRRLLLAQQQQALLVEAIPDPLEPHLGHGRPAAQHVTTT